MVVVVVVVGVGVGVGVGGGGREGRVAAIGGGTCSQRVSPLPQKAASAEVPAVRFQGHGFRRLSDSARAPENNIKPSMLSAPSK